MCGVVKHGTEGCKEKRNSMLHGRDKATQFGSWLLAGTPTKPHGVDLSFMSSPLMAGDGDAEQQRASMDVNLYGDWIVERTLERTGIRAMQKYLRRVAVIRITQAINICRVRCWLTKD
jgi:hypothetical protein